MAKGCKSGRVGGAIVVHELVCGKTFTGDKKWVEAQYKLHNKCCLACRSCKNLAFDESSASPNLDVHGIRVAGIAAAQKPYGIS